MIYYSIVPYEYTYQENSNNYVQTKFMNYKGCKIEAAVLQDGSCQIQRIISTNPKDYLLVDLQPGTIINQ